MVIICKHHAKMASIGIYVKKHVTLSPPQCRMNGKQKEDVNITSSLFEVVPPGFEPGTHGFSVRCSTY